MEMKVFAVTIMCAAHAFGCKIPSIWGGQMVSTHYSAENVEMCKRAIRRFLIWDGVNPDDFIVTCDSTDL
jgi:hypothetical protein